MKKILLVILLLPLLSEAGAWLTPPQKYQIIINIDNKKLSSLNKSQGEFSKYNELFLNSNIERGLSDNFSILSNLSLVKTINFYYLYIQDGKKKIIKEQHHYSFPKNFLHFKLGTKYKIYEHKNIIISDSIFFKILRHQKYSIENNLNFGKSGKIYKKDFFIDLEIGFEQPINKTIDSQHLNLTFGIEKNKKISYMIQFLNYRQKKYYEKFSSTILALDKTYFEHTLQISEIRNLTNNIKLQQGIYNSLNNRNSLRVLGYNISLWFNI